MRKTMCNECRYTFALKEESIETECIDIDRKIERQFFKCPNCGHKYTILISDPQMRDMINQRAVIRDRIRILREHNFTGDELAEQDEDLKNEIWERAQQLKEEYDGKGTI